MTLRIAAGAFAAMFASAALAQTAQKPATAPEAPPTRAEISQNLDAEFKALDANGDGKLAKAEIDAAVDKRTVQAEGELKKRQEEAFRKLDTDRNGQLSLAEYQAAVTIKPKAGVADRRLQLFDANKDGVVSPAEFRAPVLSRFDRIDTNKDGKISEAEAKAAEAKAKATTSR